MMSEREATALVDVLLRAYPTYPADRDTRLLYEHALQNDKHSSAVASAAVQSWIVNESRMPQINQLLDTINVEAANRRIGDSDRLRNAGALPPGMSPVVRPVAVKLRLDLLRQVHTEMHLTESARAAMTPADRREYGQRFAARLDQLVAEHADVLIDDEPVETFVCPQCLDTGWISESIDENDTTAPIRPCPCRPELYDRWRGGHFEPNHHCAACELLKRGKRSTS